MKKSTFNRLLSIFLMVMAVIFGVNGQVIMAEAATLPDGGSTESGAPAEAVVLLLLVKLAMVVLLVRVKVSRARLRDVSTITRTARSIT